MSVIGPDGRVDTHYDVVIVGSGFGGSVSALRLTEKGYRVLVLEAGRRWTKETLPKTSWDVRNYIWAPKLGMRGIQRMTLLKDVMVLSGAGVGGGSLNYANTLYIPPTPFFEDPQWAHITDWESELAPHYDQAQRMLGVVQNPHLTPADDAMRKVAARMGVEDTFHVTPVGVTFGTKPGERLPDPYFGGAGPERVGCNQCGACMTGCKIGAKNTLDTNYLYLAEANGAVIRPDTQVTAVRPNGTGYTVEAKPVGKRGSALEFSADQVIFSAGTLGTQRLLHRMRDEGVLPRISAKLGSLTRTNSEAILGAMTGNAKIDYSRGIAITSSWHPDAVTHIEPVRYGKGSNAMGMLATLMTDGGGRVPRPIKFVWEVIKHPIMFLRSMSVRRWSERTVIVLVMQTLDNSIRVFRKKGLFGEKLSSAQGHGGKNPTWIPVGNEATRLLAEELGGFPGGTLPEIFNIPMTAHIIGGAVIGSTPDEGVIDPYQRLFGHEGLHVADGSTLSANLGVNPSLSITAQAERAMSFWPNKGEADTRPPLGAPYERIEPVAPHRPAVPASASGALRWASRRGVA